MRGDLGQTPAADLCRGLADAGSTGSVTIAHPSGEAGIYFRGGHVYWAESPAPRARLGDRLVNAAILTQEQLVGALRTQAESHEHVKLGALLVEQELVTRDVIRVFVQEQLLDALFEIMSWREGSYEFIPAAVAAEDRLPVELSVDQMLVEVSRRQSEWDQIQARIPSLDMIPDFVSGGSSASAALEPDEFAVLASVDGRRSIRDLAADLGYSEFEAARIVYGLALLGIVDVRDDDADESGPEPDDSSGDADESGPEPDDSSGDADEVADATSADDAGTADADAADAELDAALGVLDDLAEEAADEDAVAEVELDLDDLAVPEDDDVDVAAALEEALYGPDDEPVEAPPAADGPPRVKIHDGPDGFQWDALDRPDDEPVPAPPPPGPSAVDEPDEVAAALSAALDGADAAPGVTEHVDPAPADEPVTATPVEATPSEDPAAEDGSLDDDASLDDGPEPFVIGGHADAETASTSAADTPAEAPAPPADDFGFFAGPDEPDGTVPELEDLPLPPAPTAPPAAPAAETEAEAERVSGADLDDSDFDRLLDELAGTGGDTGGGATAPYTSTPDPTPPPARDDAPAAATPADEMPSPPRSGGDVSEFLRELSRLAIDEPQAAPSAGAKDDDADSGSAAEQAASAAADARKSPPPPPADDKGKKRGLFGRKR